VPAGTPLPSRRGDRGADVFIARRVPAAPRSSSRSRRPRVGAGGGPAWPRVRSRAPRSSRRAARWPQTRPLPSPGPASDGPPLSSLRETPVRNPDTWGRCRRPQRGLAPSACAAIATRSRPGRSRPRSAILTPTPGASGRAEQHARPRHRAGPGTTPRSRRPAPRPSTTGGLHRARRPGRRHATRFSRAGHEGLGIIPAWLFRWWRCRSSSWSSSLRRRVSPRRRRRTWRR